MILWIKLTPACEDIFKDLKLTENDVSTIISNHAKQYCKIPDIIQYERPEKPKIEGLTGLGQTGLVGHIGWSYEGWVSTNEDEAILQDFLENKTKFKSPSIPEIKIYSEPPELAETFDYAALGLGRIKS